MNNKGIEEIERIMEMYSDDVFVSGHIEEKYINEVEEEIGLKFHKEYREYVGKFGSGGLGDIDILGIDMGIINMGLEVSVLEYLERWRGRGLEEKYIPVYHLDDIAIVVDGTDENCPVYSYYWGVEYRVFRNHTIRFLNLYLIICKSGSTMNTTKMKNRIEVYFIFKK